MKEASGAYNLEFEVDRFRSIVEGFKNSNADFDAAIGIAKALSKEFQGANSSLSAGWQQVGTGLEKFYDTITDNLKDIYKSIYEQMMGVTGVEQQQETEIESYIDYGESILKEVENVISAHGDVLK